MPLAIFIGISEADGKAFGDDKGKIVAHGDSTYLLREIYHIESVSFAVRRSDAMERRIVAELRPCAPDAAKEHVSAAVKKRIDFAFDMNEFTMKQL